MYSIAFSPLQFVSSSAQQGPQPQDQISEPQDGSDRQTQPTYNITYEGVIMKNEAMYSMYQLN